MTSPSQIELKLAFGLELLARKAMELLESELNAKIDALENAFVSWGMPAVGTEHIATTNFYYGHVPSLLNSTSDKYPNVCVFAYESNPLASDVDSAHRYNDALYIEFMVKSTANEEEVNARATRTAEAIAMVVNSNRDLLGVAVPISEAPRCQIGDVFPMNDKPAGRDGAAQRLGAQWWWQGGRIEYAIEKYSYFA